MITLDPEKIQQEVVAVVQEICAELNINVTVDDKFCPGNFIKSQVLLDTICAIEDSLGITIPNEYYIFREKNRQELSISETVQKILKVATDGN